MGVPIPIEDLYYELKILIISTSLIFSFIIDKRRKVNKDWISTMFKKDRTVNMDIEKQLNLVNGSGDNISKIRSTIDKTDIIPVMPIKKTILRLINKASIVALFAILLLNSLSFTRNWLQPLISVIAAIPIMTQSLVLIFLVSYYFFKRQRG